MTKTINKISLFSLIVACFSTLPAQSARVNARNNRTYAEAYNQVNAMRQQGQYANTIEATTASATANLPVAVDDKKLAEEILNNTSESVTMADLDACAMIYPGGVFKWGVPESGIRKNPTKQCMAVVELRDAHTKELLATTTLASGDTMKCNVDEFPEVYYSYNLKYGKVSVPADQAPTMDDVIAVLNEEQKQNAGLKIAAATLIGGVAGNLLGPKQAGSSEFMGMGGGTGRIISTVAGAAGAAGIEAASSYSGKVAGDTIKSTAVNATAGMLVGNMAAGMSGSGSVLTTVKCAVDGTEYDCIPVKKQEIGTRIESAGNTIYLIKHDGTEIQKCTVTDGKITLTSSTTSVNNPCTIESPKTNIIVAKKALKAHDPKANLSVYASATYIKNPDATNGGDILFEPKSSFSGNPGDNIYYKIDSANVIDSSSPAYAVFSHLPIKALGYTEEDWNEENVSTPIYGATLVGYYRRLTDGTVAEVINTASDDKTYKFKPLSRDATDGALIDLSNQARTKATLIGTAAGGALGGFSAYQGATTEIQERWVTAIREYNDSLTNFVCMTGDRFLSKYNDYIEIPELKKPE